MAQMAQMATDVSWTLAEFLVTGPMRRSNGRPFTVLRFVDF
jgi:hypothetical protein